MAMDHEPPAEPPKRPRDQWRLFAFWALLFGIGIGFFTGYVVGVQVGKDSITMLNGSQQGDPASVE
jgi:hypothetical protein